MIRRDCVGSLIGKHRLFERISPKKSWEGSIGGGVFSIASSFVFAHYFSFLSVWEWAGLALVVVIFGTWGDLTGIANEAPVRHQRFGSHPTRPPGVVVLIGLFKVCHNFSGWLFLYLLI